VGPSEHDESFDDDLTDEPLRGTPPDPLDRIWVHPAELPRLPSVAAPAAERVGRRSRLAVPILSGAVGALLTVGSLALVGTFDGSGPAGSRVFAEAPGRSGAVGAPTARIAGAVVTVVATGTSGRRIASGVRLEHDGAIVTTGRALTGATDISVITVDGTRHSARIEGREARHGLAFLALNADGSDGPTAAALADAPPAVGDPVWVVGAGNRAAAEPWMSTGLVSAVTAVTTGADATLTGGLIETDARSHDGTLGGALIDADGEVVAIVLGRSSIGTTLAVPIAAVLRVTEALAAGRRPGPEPIGVSLASGDASGPVVIAIAAGSPAARAGLAVGDVVTQAAGRAVVTPGDLAAVLAGAEPGETVAIEARRGSTAVRVRITVGAS